MPPRPSKTALYLKENPNGVLTKTGRAPSVMSPEALEKLKLAREKYQNMLKEKKLKKEILPEPVPEPVPEPPASFVEPPASFVEPVAEVPEVPEVPEQIVYKKSKPKKKPVVIIEESASESDSDSNVIYIKKKSNKAPPPQIPPPQIPLVVEPPAAPREVIREFKMVYSKNPFYGNSF